MKLFSCSTQLSMEFILLINMKMPTIVDIYIFIMRNIFMLSYVWQEKNAIVNNLKFISRIYFMFI